MAIIFVTAWMLEMCDPRTGPSNALIASMMPVGLMMMASALCCAEAGTDLCLDSCEWIGREGMGPSKGN